MAKTVAVEDNLTGLKELLRQEGYQVVESGNAPLNNVDAVVITGVKANFMQMEDISTPAPVINADGKTLDEVVQVIKEKCPLH